MVDTSKLAVQHFDALTSNIDTNVVPLHTGEKNALHSIAEAVLAKFPLLTDAEKSQLVKLVFYEWRGSKNVGIMVSFSTNTGTVSRYLPVTVTSVQIILPRGFNSIEDLVEVENRALIAA